jgi:DNA-binding Lrp family transcriptional regulator
MRATLDMVELVLRAAPASFPREHSARAKLMLLLVLFAERRPLHNKDIADALGCSPATSGKIVRWLLRAGLLRLHGGVRFAVRVGGSRSSVPRSFAVDRAKLAALPRFTPREFMEVEREIAAREQVAVELYLSGMPLRKAGQALGVSPSNAFAIATRAIRRGGERREVAKWSSGRVAQ